MKRKKMRARNDHALSAEHDSVYGVPVSASRRRLAERMKEGVMCVDPTNCRGTCSECEWDKEQEACIEGYERRLSEMEAEVESLKRERDEAKAEIGRLHMLLERADALLPPDVEPEIHETLQTCSEREFELVDRLSEARGIMVPLLALARRVAAFSIVGPEVGSVIEKAEAWLARTAPKGEGK